jgi:hypothetical protein
MIMRRGNCYVTSEAAYHLLGGKAGGWTPMRMRLPTGETHWFLRHRSGLVLDLTADQFSWIRPDYSEARGAGFLTKGPSRRARELMEIMLWQS